MIRGPGRGIKTVVILWPCNLLEWYYYDRLHILPFFYFFYFFFNFFLGRHHARPPTHQLLRTK